MAFINEYVPEEFKQKLNQSFDDPTRVFDKEIKFHRWVVDHDANIYLILLGGGGPSSIGDDPRGPKYYYAFSYKDLIVKFEAYFNAQGSKSEGYIEYIEVWNLNIPVDDANLQKNILQSLELALMAWGNSGGNPERIKSSVITFNLA